MSKGSIVAIVIASVVCGLFVGAIGTHAVGVGLRALTGERRGMVRAQFADGQAPAAGAGMMQGGYGARGGRMMGGGLQDGQGVALRQRMRQRIVGTNAGPGAACPNCGANVAPGTCPQAQ